MHDPLESTVPSAETIGGPRPSFVVMTNVDGETDYEPTADYLGNLALELLNRSATRVVAATGVREVTFHDAETILDDAGRLIQGLPDGEVAITIHFDPQARDPALTVGHRVARAEADLRETMVREPGEPFRPTLADVIGALHTCLDDADLAGTLPFPYLDALQYGNHLFIEAGDGVGDKGGYFRVVAERITAEQFRAMQYVLGAPDATLEEDEDAG